MTPVQRGSSVIDIPVIRVLRGVRPVAAVAGQILRPGIRESCCARLPETLVQARLQGVVIGIEGGKDRIDGVIPAIRPEWIQTGTDSGGDVASRWNQSGSG